MFDSERVAIHDSGPQNAPKSRYWVFRHSDFFGYLGIWVFGYFVIEWHVSQTRFMQNRSCLSAFLG
jgi:hypothetical protein